VILLPIAVLLGILAYFIIVKKDQSKQEIVVDRQELLKVVLRKFPAMVDKRQKKMSFLWIRQRLFLCSRATIENKIEYVTQQEMDRCCKRDFILFTYFVAFVVALAPIRELIILSGIFCQLLFRSPGRLIQKLRFLLR
jgi:hypothetical protein